MSGVYKKEDEIAGFWNNRCAGSIPVWEYLETDTRASKPDSDALARAISTPLTAEQQEAKWQASFWQEKGAAASKMSMEKDNPNNNKTPLSGKCWGHYVVVLLVILAVGAALALVLRRGGGGDDTAPPWWPFKQELLMSDS